MLKFIQSSKLSIHFRDGNHEKRKKVARLNMNEQEEHPRNNTHTRTIYVDYINQDRITRKTSLEFSTTKRKCTRCTVHVRQSSSEVKSSGAIRKLSGFFPGYLYQKERAQ